MIRSPVISYLFLFGLVSNLVLPKLFLLGKFVYPSFIISAILLFIWLIALTGSKKSYFISNKIYFILFILLSMLLSYTYAFLFLKISLETSTLFNEFLLYVPMIPFFLLFNLITLDEKQINRVILFSFTIFTIVGILQYLGFSHFITLYANEKHIAPALLGFRLVLTGINPNVGGIIASFFMMYFLSGFFYNRSIRHLLLAIVALSLIFLTQSRTTIIGTSVVASIYILVLLRLNVFFKIIIGTILLALVAYVQSLFNLSYLTQGLEDLSAGQNNSVNVRVNHIEFIFDYFTHSPVFGWSSGLENLGLVERLDSELLTIILHYGLFGTTFILYTIYNIIKTGYKYRNNRLGIFILLLMSSLTFNMATNVVFYGFQSNSIIVFLIFITYFLESKYKPKTKC